MKDTKKLLSVVGLCAAVTASRLAERAARAARSANREAVTAAQRPTTLRSFLVSFMDSRLLSM